MNAELEGIAKRVNWYTDPARTLTNTGLFLAQTMARGSADDIVAVETLIGPCPSDSQEQINSIGESARDAAIEGPAGSKQSSALWLYLWLHKWQNSGHEFYHKNG
jgi:hypothetical protein